MEEEVKKSDENLAGTITKLAVTSKDADNILKKVCQLFPLLLLHLNNTEMDLNSEKHVNNFYPFLSVEFGKFNNYLRKFPKCSF